MTISRLNPAPRQLDPSFERKLIKAMIASPVRKNGSSSGNGCFRSTPSCRSAPGDPSSILISGTGMPSL